LTPIRIPFLIGAHGLGIADLPLHHRDAFDRMLISQARCEGLTVLSTDRAHLRLRRSDDRRVRLTRPAGA
jgi:PIN domain nuclease of toxin-antitoxin system